MATQTLSFQTVLRWSNDECRDFLERMRWPDGPICSKCGEKNPYTITRKAATKNKVQSLYRCRSCRKQYTATVCFGFGFILAYVLAIASILLKVAEGVSVLGNSIGASS